MQCQLSDRDLALIYAGVFLARAYLSTAAAHQELVVGKVGGVTE